MLLIDAGNSRLKWASSHSIAVVQQATGIEELRRSLPECKTTGARAAISSVRGAAYDADLVNLLEGRGYSVFMARAEKQRKGLKCGYDNPRRLGIDRWLAMLAVWSGKGGPFVLVDLGTAITIDAVDSDGQHLGGLIHPGIKIQKEALANAASALRIASEVAVSASVELASDTASAMANGSLVMICRAITSVLEMTKTDPAALYITGGDAEALRVCFDRSQFESGLVLKGLKLLAESVDTDTAV